VISATTLSNRYTYTGREWDATLALHHFRARWMSPIAGRFLGRDPIGYEGGEWGLYEYVSTKVLVATDPSGMILIECACSCQLCYGVARENCRWFSQNAQINCVGSAESCCLSACGGLSQVNSNGRQRCVYEDGLIPGRWWVVGTPPPPTFCETFSDEYQNCSGNLCRYRCALYLGACLRSCRWLPLPAQPECNFFCAVSSATCAYSCARCRLP
jgi:RHS repeat-associated protein